MAGVLGGSDGTRPGRPRHGDRFELLFALLLLTFVLGGFVTESWARLPSLLLYAAVLLLALRSGGLSGPLARTVRVVLAVGTVMSATAVLLAQSNITQGVLACWLSVVVLATIVVIVRRVLHHQAVTSQTVFGALSVYLLIGFFFSGVFTALARLDLVPFFAGGQQATSATLQYFSFVTLTTTGYGDYTAATEAGRSLAVLEALLGQIFLVTLVARLVAMFGTVRSASPRWAAPGSAPEEQRSSAGEAAQTGERPALQHSLARDEVAADRTGRLWRRPSSRER